METNLLNTFSNVDPNQLEVIDTKLSHDIDIFAKKSQVEELFKSYFHAFNNNEQDILWMPKTLKSLHSCCKGLHFETVIRIWTLFVEELKNATTDTTKCQDVKKMHPLLKLFGEFLNSISILQLPEKALNQITSCLLDTQKVAVECINKCLNSKDEQCMARFLRLLTITVEVIFKFSILHRPFLLHTEPCGETNKLYSVGSIVVGFSDQLAGKVHKFMISATDKSAFISWIHLLLLKVKCSSLNLWKHEALISLCDFIVLELLDSIDFNETSQYTSLFWSTMCHQYHSIFETCSRLKDETYHAYNSVFSKKLVQSLFHKGTLYQEITLRFFSDFSRRDSSVDFLNDLCIQLFEKLHETLAVKKKSKKVKKDHITREQVASIVESLNQELPKLMESSTQDSISSCLQSLFECSINATSAKSFEDTSDENVTNIFDIVLNYLLPFMNRLQKIKWTLASVALLCHGMWDIELVTRCLLIIGCSFHQIKCTHLGLKYLHPSTFCSWILSLYDYFSSRPNSKEFLLCKKLCKNIFDYFVSATLKNAAQLKQIKGFFKKICEESTSNRDHLLMTNNLICKEISQQSLNADSSLLLKMGKNVIAQTKMCLKKAIKDECIQEKGLNNLPLVVETVVSLMRITRTSPTIETVGGIEPVNDVDELVSSLQDYILTAIKSCEDSEALIGCVKFIKEMCIRSSTNQFEFLNDAWTVSYEKLKCLVDTSPDREFSSSPLETQMSNLVCLLLLSMNKENMFISLQKLFSVLDTKIANWKNVYCIMKIWQSLLNQEIKEDIEETVIYSCQHVVISIQRLFIKNPPAFVTTSMLNTLSLLIQKKPNFLLLQDISIILHFTHGVNLETFPRKTTTKLTYKHELGEFVAVFQAYHRVLQAILNMGIEYIQPLIPTITVAAKKLLQASMWGGQQLSDTSLPQNGIQDLEECARSVERLASTMAEYKVDFGKIAHLLVAEFADCSQKVTLHGVVKMPLLQAVYLWLDMCNEHTISQLQISLSAGAKEIFRDIYNDFQKYHKYKG